MAERTPDAELRSETLAMRLRYRPLILHRSADFGALQVQAHALAVDQHKTLVDQLLADRASLGMEGVAVPCFGLATEGSVGRCPPK